MANNLKFNVGFNVDKADIQSVKRQIEDLKKSLSEKTAQGGMTKELEQAARQVKVLEDALNKATNNSFQKLNTKQFNAELQKSNTSLVKMYATLKDAGLEGGQAIKALNREINNTGIEIKQANRMLDDMFDTFGKTVKWGIASSIMNQITGSVQRALGFTKALDESLNNIRVVSGQNAQEMKSFANEANQAAKALGKTTTEYTDASLLFFQQGKSAEEVRKLSEATLMAANITGTDVSNMADMITSALNGYSMAADEATRVTDVLAAIGAATGSDFNELATAMSKVASQAATVGVPFEKLNAMLATISETTREAPETIGTSLKTVFSRMSEIKLEGSATDEDGVTMTLGRVQDALSLIDVSLLDTNGNMRDMASVIEEIGNKWVTIDDVAKKSAVTNAIAGQRQASRLLALFNQWDRYQVALNEAMNATGTTAEQNAIRMESMSYKAQQMRAELERLWMNLIDSDFLKSGMTFLTKLLEQVNELTESLNGFGGAMTLIGGIAVSVFSKQISGALTGVMSSFKNIANTIKASASGNKGANAEEKRVSAEQNAVTKTFSIAEQQEYKGNQQKMQDLRMEIESEEVLLDINKKQLAVQEQQIAKMEEERARLQATVDSQMGAAEDKYYAKKVEHLKHATDLQQKIKQQGLEYSEVIETLTDKEIKQLGVSKDTMRTMGSINNLVKEMRASTFDTGIINLDGDLKELQEMDNRTGILAEDMRKLRLEADLTNAKISSNTDIITKNQTKTRAVQSQLDQAGAEATKRLSAVNLTKFIGGVASSIAMLTPAIKVLGDEAASTSDKMDTIGNGLMMVGMNLAMMGGPVGMAIGAFAGLTGIILKVTKSFMAYDKAVKQNTEAIERYTRRTSELTQEIATLEKQSKTLVDLNREMALVGGDLNRMTVEQQQAYKSLGNEIAKTAPEMIAYYDSQGNAILKVGAQLDDLVKKKKDLLQQEKEVMVANKESFLIEYSNDIQLGKDKLIASQKKVKVLEEELNAMRESGAKAKKISKKSDELETAKQEVIELQERVNGVDSNIQKNIIDPFMSANKEIVKVDDSVKQVVASTYSLEKIQLVMDKYKDKWEVVNGQAVKVQRSYKEMAGLVSEELADLEKQSTLVAGALNRITERASKENGDDKTYSTIADNLKRADQAAQTFIGTIAALGVTTEGSVRLLEKMASTVDQFGMVKNVNIQDTIKIRTEEAKKEVESLNKEVAALSEEFDKSADRVQKTASMYSQSGHAIANPNADLGEFSSMEERNLLELKLIDKIKERDEAQKVLNSTVRQSIYEQDELNRKYEDYLFQVASTPEGMNQLINSYNEEYEKHKLINEELNKKAELVKQTVENEDGTKQEVETQTYEDTQVGQMFYDFNEMIIDLIEGGFTDLGSEFQTRMEEMAEAGNKTAIEISDSFSEMGQTLQDLPSGALDSFADMSEEMAGYVEDIQKNGAKASTEAIAAVGTAVQKQQQDVGRMYATINKDNVHYFAEVKKQNVEQMQITGITTGVMAENYSTYAEYKAALDKWMAENSSWLADAEASDRYWAAAQAINAKYQEQIANEMANGNMEEADRLSSEARAKASEAAAWAGALAEAKAARERSIILQNSLSQIDTSTTNKEIGAAAKTILERKAAEIEADIALYDSLISQLQAKLDSVGGTDSGGGGGGGSSAPNLNLTPGGGGVRPVPTAPSRPSGGGGGTDLSGGGSDKGGKDKEEKEVEDLEWEEDIYHDINIELEKKSQLLEKLKKQQDKLYGKELLDNLEKQRQILEQQQKLQERKLQMQKQDLSNRKSSLAGQGVQFNEDGTIANYNELLRQKLAYVNSLSGEAKEAAKEEFQALVDMMEQYEELLMNGVYETENAIQDLIDQQREIFLQKFEYAIQLKIEISTDLKEALDYMKEMNDSFEDASENYDRTKEQIKEQTDLVERLKKKITEIQNDPNLTEKEKLELLEKYNKELMDATKTLKDLNEGLTEIFKDTLKEGMDLIKEHMENFKYLNEQLEHYEQVLKLIGEGDNFAILDDIYEAQYANLMGQIDVLNGTMATLQAQKKALEDAGMEGSEEWKAIDEAIKQTQGDINALAKEALKLLQDEFKNSVDEILKTLDDAMSGGAGMDALKKQHKEIKDERKKYLDGEEKILEISKLQEKVQKEIEATNDPAKKAELQKFMDTELKKLKEKDKLTKYDIDRANMMYDITLKQMALEDQRATKNIMRLVRDTQGNWVYEFTEDAKAIEKAQEDLSSAMEKLMELDKKKLEETQDLMLQLQEEYYKEVQQISQDAANGKYKTEEELRKALQEVTDKYNKKMEDANAEYEAVKQNATISSMAVIIDAYNKTGDVLGTMTDEQKLLFEKLASATNGSFLDMSQTIGDLISGDEDSIAKAMEKLGITTEAEMGATKDAVDGLVKNMHEDWGLAVTDMISSMIGDGGFEQASKSAIDGIIEKWKEYQSKVDEVQKETGLDTDDIKNGIGDIANATEDLNKKTDDLAKKFKEEMDALVKLTAEYEKNRKEIEENIKKTLEFIETINKAIDAIKRKNDIEDEINKPEPTPPPPPTPPTPTPPPPPTPPTPPGMGSRVRVKPGRRWYYDSYGTNPSGPTDPYADRDLYIVNTSGNRYQYAVGSNSSVSSALGWLTKEDLVGFDTGGYTGAWGRDGKMAMLHEKEIVLNKDDTNNILDAVKLVRNISTGAIDGITNSILEISKKAINALSGSLSLSGNQSSNSGANSGIIQHIEINADFSGVKNAEEIERAFENMSNIASQYVNRNS